MSPAGALVRGVRTSTSTGMRRLAVIEAVADGYLVATPAHLDEVPARILEVQRLAQRTGRRMRYRALERHAPGLQALDDAIELRPIDVESVAKAVGAAHLRNWGHRHLPAGQGQREQ